MVSQDILTQILIWLIAVIVSIGLSYFFDKQKDKPIKFKYVLFVVMVVAWLFMIFKTVLLLNLLICK